MTASAPLWIDEADAVLFDLDGVVTDTAAVHQQAWRALFEPLLAERTPNRPYREDDYFRYIDGMPRFDGVRALLASRDLRLPDGDPGDPPDASTVCGLGNRKNAVFGDILRRDGVRVFAGTVRLLDHLAGIGIPVALVSSSRNAQPVLAAAGLTDRFPVVIDGEVAARDHLHGKPAPDMFRRAAADLGVAPERSVVIEDAVSGVEAGHAGGFPVVGVDRGVGADTLLRAGADRVVADPGDLLTPAEPAPIPSPDRP
ncbi:beta-phosphoglucomutase family hydrolase [Tsukamurella soli]|uniref:Beta-phosphoglucomutase n=1 Tax=Tsukamurella soli TaxID=644556 RepID=A0ABP8J386_9ACTN